jgi:general secretion pathway protein D
MVKDGHTVVLGGLIDEQSSLVDYGIPCLGDIPLLGWLFSSEGQTQAQGNLYFFLTPRVIQNPEEATQVADTKRTEIDNLQEKFINLYEEKSFWSHPFNSEQEIETPDGGQKSPAVQGEPGSGATAPVTETSTSLSTKAPPVERAASDTPIASTAVMPQNEGSPEVSASSAESDQHTPKAEPPGSGVTATQKSNSDIGVNGYTIQVISAQDAEAARKLVVDLNDLDYAAYIVRKQIEEQTWYRVRIGFFNTRAEAADVLKTLRGHHYKPILIQLY